MTGKMETPATRQRRAVMTQVTGSSRRPSSSSATARSCSWLSSTMSISPSARRRLRSAGSDGDGPALKRSDSMPRSAARVPCADAEPVDPAGELARELVPERARERRLAAAAGADERDAGRARRANRRHERRGARGDGRAARGAGREHERRCGHPRASVPKSARGAVARRGGRGGSPGRLRRSRRFTRVIAAVAAVAAVHPGGCGSSMISSIAREIGSGDIEVRRSRRGSCPSRIRNSAGTPRTWRATASARAASSCCTTSGCRAAPSLARRPRPAPRRRRATGARP